MSAWFPIVHWSPPGDWPGVAGEVAPHRVTVDVSPPGRSVRVTFERRSRSWSWHRSSWQAVYELTHCHHSRSPKTCWRPKNLVQRDNCNHRIYINTFTFLLNVQVLIHRNFKGCVVHISNSSVQFVLWPLWSGWEIWWFMSGGRTRDTCMGEYSECQ